MSHIDVQQIINYIPNTLNTEPINRNNDTLNNDNLNNNVKTIKRETKKLTDIYSDLKLIRQGSNSNIYIGRRDIGNHKQELAIKEIIYNKNTQDKNCFIKQ